MLSQVGRTVQTGHSLHIIYFVCCSYRFCMELNVRVSERKAEGWCKVDYNGSYYFPKKFAEGGLQPSFCLLSHNFFYPILPHLSTHNIYLSLFARLYFFGYLCINKVFHLWLFLCLYFFWYVGPWLQVGCLATWAQNFNREFHITCSCPYVEYSNVSRW